MKIKEYIALIFLTKRARSFYWRTAMMAIAGLAVIVSEELGSLEIDTTTTVILGLVLGEISKGIRNSIISMENDGIL